MYLKLSFVRQCYIIMWALELLWLVRPWLDLSSSQLAQLGAIYVHLMCVPVPGLNSGTLAVYSCDHAHGNLQV